MGFVAIDRALVKNLEGIAISTVTEMLYSFAIIIETIIVVAGVLGY